MALQNLFLFVSVFYILSVSPGKTQELTTEPPADCSYAVIDEIRYEPLGTCVSVDGRTSRQASCDKDGKIQLTQCPCNGKLCALDTTDMSITGWQCATTCSTLRKAAVLLPRPITPTPTKSPTTPNPTVTTSSTSIETTHTDNTDDTDGQASQDDEFNTVSHHPMALPIHAYASIPIHALCFVITFCLFCASLYHLLGKKPDQSKRSIVWTVKVFVLLTFMSNMIGIACIMIVSMMISTNTGNKWTQHTYEMTLIPYYVISVAYSFGKFNLECFFLFRVYTAFRNSTYALSQGVCVSLVVCMLIVSSVWCYMFVGDVYNDQGPYYVYVLVSLLEMCLIVVLLYLFLKRLSELILRHKLDPTHRPSTDSQMSKVSSTPSAVSPSVDDSRKQSIPMPSTTATDGNGHVPMPSASPMPMSSPKPSRSLSSHLSTVTESTPPSTSVDVKSFQSQLSRKQTKWIFLMTRCILLSSVALVTTIGFGFLAFYWAQFNTVHIFLVYALWSIDMTTNSVCLYLNFIFANGLYDKACHVCHGLCQNMVERAAAKKMLSRYLNDVKNIQDSANI
eukprot:728965_1